MLYDPNGRPISTAKPNDDIRTGAEMDLNALPKCAVSTRRRSFDLHQQIVNNSVLRERLETAQRMTGHKLMHLDIIKMTHPQTEKRIVRHVDFTEKVLNK
jgi:hypothetical protein